MSRDAHDSRPQRTDFPEVDYLTWRTRVSNELEDRDFEETLVSRLTGGLEVQPLYSREKRTALESLVGHASASRGWLICQSYFMTDLGVLAKSIQQDLTNGVQGFSLRFDKNLEDSQIYTGSKPLGDDVAAQHRDRLDQIFPESFPLPEVLLLDAGVAGLSIGEGLASWMDARQISPADLPLGLGIDPLGQLAAAGALPISAQQAADQMKRAVKLSKDELSGSRALGVSAEIYLNGGADASLQLALALSTAVEYMRWLDDLGVSPRDSVDQFVFRFGIGKDLFGEISKLRAFRYLWHKVARHCGTEPQEPIWIHAETADRVLTSRDVATNLLRSATGTVAAILGGADTIACSAYDSARGDSSARGRRLARNIQHILQQESHLDLTNDPSRGSYYIESLTKEMAGAAWEHFRRLERQGGMLAALKTGTVQKSLANLWETRRRRIADRRDPITGISFFADPDEAPPNTDRSSPVHPSEQTETLPTSESALIEIKSIESHRDSADYEDLRCVADRLTDAQGSRPAVFVLPVPDLLPVRESVSFARNFFRAGGFRVIVSDRRADPSNDDSERFPREDWSQTNSQIVCICSESGISQQIEGKLASEAKQAGATSVVRVSSKPQGSEPPAPPEVDLSIHPGTDAVALLTRLLDTIGDASGGGE